jgi:DNA-binding HxlR family transcriptional regulator
MHIRGKDYNCTIDLMMDIIGGKWKMRLLWTLMMDGSQRFGELKRRCVKISAKVLAQQLKELEQDELITRKSYDEVPPRVEYSISEYGKTVIPFIKQMHEWSFRHMIKNGVEVTDNDRKS